MAKPQKQYSYIKDQAIDKDVKTLYDWVSRLDVTTTAPNGSRKGIIGEGIFYNNGGTFSLWVNTTGSTVWSQI